MTAHVVRKLHLGAGAGPLAGWLNTDLVVYHDDVTHLDATKPFPIPDASFDYVYGEHLIEHLPLERAAAMLKECARILRPGGRVRFATPPLETILGMYAGLHPDALAWASETWPPSEWKGQGPTNACLVLNALFRQWGHQFLYDKASLEGLLTRAGFRCQWFAMGESADPHLRSIEQHGRIFGNEAMVALTTMVVEGTR